MHDEKGGASVELALALPLFAILIVLLAQVGVLVQRQLLVSGAAREAARAACVGTDGDGIRVARQVAHIDPMSVEMSRSGQFVTARLVAPADIRIVGIPLMTIEAKASVTMLAESETGSISLEPASDES